MAELSLEETRYVAQLARMRLEPEELEHMRAQLSSILNYMQMLQEIDLEDIPPTAQVTGLTSVMRPDEVLSSLTTQEVLNNAPAPDTSTGMFRVKAVFDED